ncbi:SUMF1/EgtB/PvdO family nonheme iron enzyme [Hugenholtzia roseola]|uniref:SUMF1/EgtB/PvdO family nonheme iron enzyme n=1 Tax=Hugenholtzia roseola TaxID=1002 RepID=UPI00042371B7|nr:SUMF1/EgtB/PvdO family nonheme iron enzyme [Hugenholtzia roseola]
MKIKLKKIYFILITFHLLLIPSLCANGLIVSDLALIDAGRLHLRLAWENAWHNDLNHDGVWLFVKYRRYGGAWQHLDLSATKAAHLVQNVDLEVEAVSDGKGIFVYPQQKGFFSDIETELTLSFSENLSLLGQYDFRVFAVEMVWIPEGGFWVGDGIGTQNALRKGGAKALDSLDTEPFWIESEAEISVGTAANQLYGSAADDWSPKGNIPATFPKGFASFWVMKYEITQIQYADFLNTLTFEQQKNRTRAAPDSPPATPALSPAPLDRAEAARSTLVVAQSADALTLQPARYACDGNLNGVFNEPQDGKERACNWLDGEDLLAYLEWAALRPLTELEFEKIARGRVFPKKGEFPWQTIYLINGYGVENEGSENETLRKTETFDPAISRVDSAGFANYNSGIDFRQLAGVTRVGFGAAQNRAEEATQESENEALYFKRRLQAGASPYGVLELSGNVWEACVTLEAVALRYQGNVGSGNLDAEGKATVWRFAPAADLLRLRGGGWNSTAFEVGNFRDTSVSARYYANLRHFLRRDTTGGRGAR